MHQPDLPIQKDGTSLALPSVEGFYLVYLDVHEQHKTGLDDPEIVESALGGPDTATRNKIVWQIKFHHIEASTQEWEEMMGALSGSRDNFPINCETVSSFWDSFVAPPIGTMQARTKPEVTIDDPCMLPPGAGYRRLENQLYRVEIHTPGNTDGGATFKWQRDNGSIVTKATDITEKTITVTGIGKDRLLGFNSQQWVEIIDDRHELLNLPGTLAKINVVSETELAVDGPVKGDPLTNENFPQEFNPKVRRWDSPSGEIQITIPPLNDGWIELEDGMEVRFNRADSSEAAFAQYKTGDYWQIPARTIKRDIEWPKSGGEPQSKIRDGVNHHYAPLGLIMYVDEAIHVVDDCRNIFPPLTDLSPSNPPPVPQMLTDLSVWLHGNAVWSEEKDPSIVIRSFEPIGGGPTGGGARFEFTGSPSSTDDGVYWFHFPFSTSLPPDKPQALLTDIKLLFNDTIPPSMTEPENKILIRVFDGPALINTFSGDIPLGPLISGNKLFVLKIDPPYKMNFGLGLSVGIFSTEISQGSELFFSSAGAEFKLKS